MKSLWVLDCWLDKSSNRTQQQEWTHPEWPYRSSVQTLIVEQTLLQAGFLHSHLEMGHLLHMKTDDEKLWTDILPLRESDHKTNIWISVSNSAALTLTLSGRPSSRRLSFSRFAIVLTVSSTFGLVLLLLLSCCSSVPVSAASFWSMLVPPCPLSPTSSDCLSFSSKRGQKIRRKHIYLHIK